MGKGKLAKFADMEAFENVFLTSSLKKHAFYNLLTLLSR